MNSIRFDAQDGVGIITIDRPDAMNALGIETLRALRAALVELRDRSDLRVAVLTGAGTRAFCAGADLKGTRASPASYAEAVFRSTEAAADLGLYIRLMDLAELGLNKPMIAAINGHCLGAGLELALQCDLRIASATAQFGLPEARVGSIPAVGGLHRLLRAVPPAHAMQMALTGERIGAAHAQHIGLVSEVVEPAALLDRALALAAAIAANAPLAVQAIKRLSRQTLHLSDSDAQQLTELTWGALRDTQDRIEGRQAFADKRAPVFAGR
ncbi:enoyl-CoA hydratase/isomerase family protein [Aquincola sp. S2]|uniref:Enoyl-CoA hydratase/isomerase family protein n=1 Tax=Pseudaquabacterium terrae TaxID=2732868 RepID=A0ABX2ERG7_9BURK|nr:enoyl-CoA hydratase/isomerase family protein [Aquabacterium terrae]NRF71049.1 enoyl-CoA hydratase/isomerase family protein [Aquabacterium terrae]